MIDLLIDMTERGVIPNSLVRIGIRHFCKDRLRSLQQIETHQTSSLNDYVEMLKKSPVAIATDSANEQHYEVPTEFFLLSLGSHLKYSCAYWPENCDSLDMAEKLALDTTMERAEIKDGMSILELGCGWGSLTLSMAKKFPNSIITAISNSSSQREFILAQAQKHQLNNIEVLTEDISQLEKIPGKNNFDRVVSVEMFEHLRNYQTILARIKDWLAPQGKLFVHIFTHHKYPYLFETEGADNWMGKYFFTGGQMPSHSLLRSFQNDLKLEKEWQWDGTHYQKTSEAWLKNLEANKDQVLKLFDEAYGAKDSLRWYNRWKVFYLAVAELFGFKNGTEWGVSHYLFAKESSNS